MIASDPIPTHMAPENVIIYYNQCNQVTHWMIEFLMKLSNSLLRVWVFVYWGRKC